MNDFIPVSTPLFLGNEKKYLEECIETGWVSSAGPFVKRFEDEMASLCKRKFALTTSSGTTALDLAVRILDLKEDDEVIVPSFTIIACINCIIRAGAKPVLVDVSDKHFNTSIEFIEKKVTEKTKAIILPHMYNFPIDLDPILDLAKNNNIKIIEDAAQMNGQYYKEQPCGSFGDISIFSFYANKQITTGEGGMLLTNDNALYKKAHLLRDQAFIPGNRFVHEEIGYNFRMTNLQAAIGCAQLEYRDKIIEKKITIGKLYTELLKENKYFDIPPVSNNFATNNYWVFPILLKEEFKIKNSDLAKKLADRGIGTRPFFFPLHAQPVFKNMGLFQNEEYPNSEKISSLGLYLPSGISLTSEEIKRCAQSLIECIEELL